MGKRFITALLALLLIGAQAFAQFAVSGKVTDETGGTLCRCQCPYKGHNNRHNDRLGR